MLPIYTPIPKIAKKAQTGREQQTPNVFDTFFCCVKLPPINEALFNMNNKKALCLYCDTFNIFDYERFASVISGNNCLLLDDARCGSYFSKKSCHLPFLLQLYSNANATNFHHNYLMH